MPAKRRVPRNCFVHTISYQLVLTESIHVVLLFHSQGQKGLKTIMSVMQDKVENLPVGQGDKAYITMKLHTTILGYGGSKSDDLV